MKYEIWNMQYIWFDLIYFHIWYFLFGSPSCSVGAHFDIFGSVFFYSVVLRFDFFHLIFLPLIFLFPFWSSLYLLCLVTFYLICSHWKVLNIFYSKFKNSRISPVVCQYCLQKNLNTSGDSLISSYDVILLCELWLLVDYNIIKRKVTLILLKHE